MNVTGTAEIVSNNSAVFVANYNCSPLIELACFYRGFLGMTFA
jgi:hypothetical protein